MKKIVKAVYEAPVVELFAARVEKGFAGSNAIGGEDIPGAVVNGNLEPKAPDQNRDDVFMGQ